MLASAYAKFRGSAAFLFILVLYIGAWVTAHLISGFDPDWGLLNLTLSIEASVSVAILIMDADKYERVQRKQLHYMQHLLEAMVELLDASHVARNSPTDQAASAGMAHPDAQATQTP